MFTWRDKLFSEIRDYATVHLGICDIWLQDQLVHRLPEVPKCQDK